MLRKVFEKHVCNNLCYSYERPLPLSETEQVPVRSSGKGELVSDDDDEEEDQDWFIMPNAESQTSDDAAQQRLDSISSYGEEDVFQTNNTTELTVMLDCSDYSDGQLESAANGFPHKVFSLGKEGTSEDLAYCCTDLSRSVIEEIEEEQRKAEEKRAESESSGKTSERAFFRRIHLGDQIKKEEPARKDKEQKTFDLDEPLHRCNVQAVGGIEKRPSI